jgi:hypothetical protein
MENSSPISWKLVPLRHFFPLKVVPLIEVLLYILESVLFHREIALSCPGDAGFNGSEMGVWTGLWGVGYDCIMYLTFTFRSTSTSLSKDPKARESGM